MSGMEEELGGVRSVTSKKKKKRKRWALLCGVGEPPAVTPREILSHVFGCFWPVKWGQ